MQFREILGVLSKSSPYAVTTQRESSGNDEIDLVKNYLYIKTDIEINFESHLSSLLHEQKRLIFLCGSSGDGKSEILTRYSQKYHNKIDFHLDATHSFSARETAIERLNVVFEQYEAGDRSLVVGINTGMLGNYSEEGGNSRIKRVIRLFLQSAPIEEEFVFLDFEKYPKFQFESGNYSSKFTEQLLQRITAEENNIIRKYFETELSRQDTDSVLCINYQLLSIPSIQRIIVELLLKARLVKDQFLTARALLDFVYNLLCGESYLFENLFASNNSEIIAKIAEFDPSLLRTKQIDQFILSMKLSLEYPKFEEFRTAIKEKFDIDFRRLRSPESNIRLFYLLQNEDLGNDFHHQFRDDFKDSLLASYSNFWRLHNASEVTDVKQQLKAFYRDILLAAISKYNNRAAPHLTKNDFLLATRGGVHITTQIDLKHDSASIKSASKKNLSQIGCFYACLKVGETPLRRVAININLLGLLFRICEGYQPNKHDKNTVVLLDELVEELHEIASKANALQIFSDKTQFRLSMVDEVELEVSGG